MDSMSRRTGPLADISSTTELPVSKGDRLCDRHHRPAVVHRSAPVSLVSKHRSHRHSHPSTFRNHPLPHPTCLASRNPQTPSTSNSRPRLRHFNSVVLERKAAASPSDSTKQTSRTMALFEIPLRKRMIPSHLRQPQLLPRQVPRATSSISGRPNLLVQRTMAHSRAQASSHLVRHRRVWTPQPGRRLWIANTSFPPNSCIASRILSRTTLTWCVADS